MPKLDITQTPAFKAWFNGSKVVDNQGNPLKMYHSTTKDFDTFDTEMAELGSHFGTLAQASDRGSDKYDAKGMNIKPVYLSIKNPIRLVDTGNFQGILFVRGLILRGILNKREWEKASNGREPTQLNSSEMQFIKKSLISKGYDGAVYLNRNEGLGVSDEEFENLRGETGSDIKFRQRVPSAQDSWIAFFPNQIKSAIGNSGKFDPNNPSITAGIGTTMLTKVALISEDNGPTSGLITLKGRPHFQSEGTSPEDSKNRGSIYYKWDNGVLRIELNRRSNPSFEKTLKVLKDTLEQGDYEKVSVDIDGKIVWAGSKAEAVSWVKTLNSSNPVPQKSKTDITQTPEFKAWFKGSKVVDANGNPLKVFHSTKTDYDTFDTEMAELGSHFGTLKQAEARGSDGDSTWGLNIKPVYLSIKNPIRLVDFGDFDSTALVKDLLVRGIINEQKWEEMRGERKNHMPSLNDMKFIKKSLVASGYDGAVYLNRAEGLSIGTKSLRDESDAEFKQRAPAAEDSWIAFFPNQIKSAIGNSGKFDPNNPSTIAKLQIKFDAPDPFSRFFE